MAREKFIDHRFTAASMALIKQASDIMREYAAQGFRLSLRQLFYQMVSRDLLPNTQRNYKNLGSIITDARMAGYLDWSIIEDRGRDTEWDAHWRSPQDIVKAAAQQYKIDKWKRQPNHVEIMVEKDALSGVLGPVCRELDVRLTANKGYGSVSLFYEVGKRVDYMAEQGKDVYIIYMGDHDPSGMDMTRDVRERVELFSGRTIDVIRAALNMDQVTRWNPPPNTAKQTDSRHHAYVMEFGPRSWELDAINPTDLAALVRRQVLELRDDGLWKEAEEEEEEHRAKLIEFTKEDDEDEIEDETEDDDED